MNHERDRYSYYIEIGRYLGVKISTANDLRKHLPPIPGIEAKDLRKLDNLKMILKHLEQGKMSETIDKQLFEDAIARLKYELNNKELQIAELNDRLANADVHLCHVYNDLHDREKKLAELSTTNNKYRGLIGLQMEGENKETYSLTPCLVLYVQMRGPDGNWIALKSSRLKFPLIIEDLNKEFNRLVSKIENPSYEDEIGY